MIDCTWDKTADGVVCNTCGRPSRKAVKRNCRKVLVPNYDQCGHRGDRLRDMSCDSCGGKQTRLKVFACAVHGECSLSRKATGVRYCGSCDDVALTEPTVNRSPARW